jgi:DNA (cytosine-5)-methyltransferase 1
VKPRILDLFCGAGGAAMGYSRAGFDVVGVDIAKQPHYPFEFIQADALDVLEWLTDYATFRMDEDRYPLDLTTFEAIHASPPCQAFTAYRRTGNVGEYPDLIAPTRGLLEATGLAWVMENVAGAPLIEPLMLCGSMFDLDVQRHRYFESNVRLASPAWPCRHKIWAPDRYPGGRSVERTGSSRGLVRSCVEIGSWDIPLPVQQRAMGIDWMTLEELSEAISPDFTQYIGAQLMQHIERERAA